MLGGGILFGVGGGGLQGRVAGEGEGGGRGQGERQRWSQERSQRTHGSICEDLSMENQAYMGY